MIRMRRGRACAWLALVLLAAGCGGGGGGSGSGGTPPPPPPSDFSIGGQVAGLAAGQQVELRNGGEVLVVSANGSFVFGSRQASGASYAVSVGAEPQDRQCDLSAQSGIVGSANVVSIRVACHAAANWIADGEVLSTALSADGRVLYLAGRFGSVGPRTGSFVPLDATSGAVATFPAVNGRVLARVADGSGGWYLGGEFVSVGSVAQSFLAHVRADGTVDPAFRPAPDASVGALALTGGKLFVGGGFAQIGGASRAWVAALDPTNGHALPWSVTLNGAVQRLAAGNGTLYMNGFFVTAGGQPRSYLAAADTASGAVTNWDPQVANGSGTPTFSALAVVGSTVYVAGVFRTIGGQPRAHVAALDGVTGAASAWDARVGAVLGGGAVYAMTVDAGTVYIGGAFDSAGGQARGSVAALDPVTGDARSWDPGLVLDGVFPPEVTALATSGDTVFIGGRFRTIGGRASLNIGAVDKTTAVGRAWYGGAALEFQSLDVVGTQVWVGGPFSTIGGQPRRRIAAIDTKTGLPTDWNPDASSSGSTPDAGSVDTLLVDGGRVYAAGAFDRIGGQDRAGLAALDAASGAALPWSPVVTGSVRALAVSGSTLYLGGFGLTAVNGQARSNLAAVNAVSGALLAWTADAQNAQINKLLVDGSTVYVGGIFSTLAGQARSNAAALDAATGTLLAWNPDVRQSAASGSVTDMAVKGTTVYLSGYFDSAGGRAQFGLARVDAGTGIAPAGSFIGVPLARALALDGDTLYVATNRGGGNPPAAGVVAVDLASGSVAPFSASLEGHANSLSVSAGTVYAGGDFTAAQGLSGQGIAFLPK